MGLSYLFTSVATLCLEKLWPRPSWALLMSSSSISIGNGKVNIMIKVKGNILHNIVQNIFIYFCYPLVTSAATSATTSGWLEMENRIITLHDLDEMSSDSSLEFHNGLIVWCGETSFSKDPANKIIITKCSFNWWSKITQNNNINLEC